MSFFKDGFSSRPKGGGKKFQSRFWLPKDMDPKDAVSIIVIHKGQPVGFWEHQVKINGDWRNWFTCLKENGISKRCPLCQHGEYKAYYVGALTIIDRSSYENKKGEQITDSKRLLMAKSEMLGRFELMASKRGGELYGTEWSVCRTGANQAPSIGDYWDFQKKWTKAELAEEFAEKLEADENFLKVEDYETWFKPLSEEDLEAIVEQLPDPEGKGSKRSDRFAKKSSKPPRRDDDDDDEEEAKPAKKSSKPVVEDDDEDEPAPVKKAKPPVDDDEDEVDDSADGTEDDDEEALPVKKSGKPDKDKTGKSIKF